MLSHPTVVRRMMPSSVQYVWILCKFIAFPNLPIFRVSMSLWGYEGRNLDFVYYLLSIIYSEVILIDIEQIVYKFR